MVIASSGLRAFPAALAFADHFRQIGRGANLEWPDLHARVFRHELDGVIEVPGFEHKNAAQLLLGLGVRSVDNGGFAVFPAERGGATSALERFAPRKGALLLQYLIVGEAGIHE